MPRRIHLLFTELMAQADQIDPELVVYEIEDLQDQLVSLCDPDESIVALKEVYKVLADAKQDFRLRS